MPALSLLKSCPSQHVVHEPAGHGALRHPPQGVVVKLGLAQRQAAVLPDRRDAQRPAAAEPRQDDGDRVLALIFRQRCQERVHRGAAGCGQCRTGKAEDATLDGQDGVGRDDVDHVRADHCAVPGEAHRQLRVAGDDCDQLKIAL